MESGYTGIQQSRTVFVWKINTLCLLSPDGKDTPTLTSPMFSTCLNGISSKWQLSLRYNYKMTRNVEQSMLSLSTSSSRLYLDVNDHHRTEATTTMRMSQDTLNKKVAVNKSNIVSYGIFLASTEKPKVTAIVKFQVFDCDNSEIVNWCYDSPHVFVSNAANTTGPEKNLVLYGGDHNLIKTMRDAKPDDDLIKFQCEIIELGDTIIKCRKRKLSDCETASIINDYKQLLESQDLADVTIVVGTEKKEYKAHIAILAARSPVFKVMFMNDMKEQQEKSVNIPDVNPKVLEQMLKFIYTNTATITDIIACDLMAVADQYQIDDLKRLCIEFLYKNGGTAIENAIENLIVADRYDCSEWKTQVKDFIMKHKVEVMLTPEFQQLLNEPKLRELLKETFN